VRRNSDQPRPIAETIDDAKKFAALLLACSTGGRAVKVLT
jgi:hypothetical protein